MEHFRSNRFQDTESVSAAAGDIELRINHVLVEIAASSFIVRVAEQIKLRINHVPVGTATSLFIAENAE